MKGQFDIMFPAKSSQERHRLWRKRRARDLGGEEERALWAAYHRWYRAANKGRVRANRRRAQSKEEYLARRRERESSWGDERKRKEYSRSKAYRLLLGSKDDEFVGMTPRQMKSWRRIMLARPNALAEGYQIDHIAPWRLVFASFGFDFEKSLLAWWNVRNLRWITAEENMEKGGKSGDFSIRLAARLAVIVSKK